MREDYYGNRLREQEIHEANEKWTREIGKRARSEECREEEALGRLKPETIEEIKKQMALLKAEAEIRGEI